MSLQVDCFSCMYIKTPRIILLFWLFAHCDCNTASHWHYHKCLAPSLYLCWGGGSRTAAQFSSLSPYRGLYYSIPVCFMILFSTTSTITTTPLPILLQSHGNLTVPATYQRRPIVLSVTSDWISLPPNTYTLALPSSICWNFNFSKRLTLTTHSYSILAPDPGTALNPQSLN